MAEVYHRDEPADSGALYTALKEEEASGYVDRLWEVKMLRQQNPDLRKLRHDIDNKILEMQLRQLENEIKECLREIETAESFPNETYRRYEMLKKSGKPFGRTAGRSFALGQKTAGIFTLVVLSFAKG